MQMPLILSLASDISLWGTVASSLPAHMESNFALPYEKPLD